MNRNRALRATSWGTEIRHRIWMAMACMRILTEMVRPMSLMFRHSIIISIVLLYKIIRRHSILPETRIRMR
ncbi:hypothetical protein DVK06_14290 [Halorubrum sp. Atlit-28R]|nr:hypothetical protein DVK06_14290 [Halorubrum sp. Atlit-28R]